MKLSRFALLLLGGLPILGCVSHAASLNNYFNFTGYGTVAGGATLTSNAYGNTEVTIKTIGTTLNSAGLAIEEGHLGGETGVYMEASALRAFTGDFSIQIWFTTGGTIAPDTALFGGTTSKAVDQNLTGDQALWVSYNNKASKAQFIRLITGGSKWGTTMDNTKIGTGTAPNTLYDYILTYSSSTRSFIAYLNGTQVGTMTANGFNGLSALANGFAIGGIHNPAFTDQSAAIKISSFLMYTGTLSAQQVADIHAFGSDVTVKELVSAGISASAN